MVEKGKNGYLFASDQPYMLADLMQRITERDNGRSLGQHSLQLSYQFSPRLVCPHPVGNHTSRLAKRSTMTKTAVPLRILYVDHAPIWGGAEAVLMTLLHHLDRQQFQPVVATAPRFSAGAAADRQRCPRAIRSL
ncbi:MAG: hypothetical protein M5U34_11410 [Chloroflexi bacterium]|nr:hypothetical protein [Chloroflexota bacterium]